MTPSLANLPEELQGRLRRTEQARWSSPMLATLTHEHFFDESWLYERKLDGERAVVVCNRYVSANLAHQGCKIDEPDDREAFHRWVDKME